MNRALELIAHQFLKIKEIPNYNKFVKLKEQFTKETYKQIFGQKKGFFFFRPIPSSTEKLQIWGRRVFFFPPPKHPIIKASKFGNKELRNSDQFVRKRKKERKKREMFPLPGLKEKKENEATKKP